ncbi:hypothetical protein [Paenimyroides ceti]|uniref:hypothetical protein n=1 Tax=Paenimyroides ceti TaxID=395087 RepID=UPI0037CB33F4
MCRFWSRYCFQKRIYPTDKRSGNRNYFTVKIEKTTGSSTWAADNKSLFYSRKDEQTLRPDQILKHCLGTATQEDVLIYNEKDETFSTYIYRSKSKKYLIIGSDSTLTTEYRILEATNLLVSLVFFRREQEVWSIVFLIMAIAFIFSQIKIKRRTFN